MEVDVSKSSTDSKRAKIPPIISYSLPFDNTELGTTTITIANSDPNNSIVHLFSKTGMNSTYSMLGSYDIPAGEAEIIEDVVVDTLERTVFRAVVGSSSNSQAFSDVIYSPLSFGINTNTAVTIHVSSTPLNDGSSQVTVQTTPAEDGDSAWDYITIKRLDSAEGETIESPGWLIAENASVTTSVIDDGVAAGSEGPATNAPQPGKTYTYAVDGYTDTGGFDYGVGNVEFIVPVEEIEVIVTVNELSGPNKAGPTRIMFEVLGTVSVPDGHEAIITLSETSILITDDSTGEQYQFTPVNFQITEDGEYGFSMRLVFDDEDDMATINSLAASANVSMSVAFSIQLVELADPQTPGTVTWISDQDQGQGQGPPLDQKDA